MAQFSARGSAVVNGGRRKFVILTAIALAVAGAAKAFLKFFGYMQPSADVQALSTVELNISDIKPGNSRTVMWQGKPVFVKHRNPEEIKAAASVALDTLPDPESDAQRTKPGKDQWLVLVGICTHLGCVPRVDDAGTYKGGWICPCHGSYYDASGRIRKGPAPKNLAVPKYYFANDSTIVIGEDKGEQ